eukprot:TRINITY_DN11284_c0_g1_i2.p1 TRINITY_DN11284_c0_g1~~TRINITY_DN11284_c0_g1_i2.p1  ORF type:complete len:482 (+),score=23.71 TRINITY_DN11284_c0_g1_i2:43-1488(+)
MAESTARLLPTSAAIVLSGGHCDQPGPDLACVLRRMLQNTKRQSLLDSPVLKVDPAIRLRATEIGLKQRLSHYANIERIQSLESLSGQRSHATHRASWEPCEGKAGPKKTCSTLAAECLRTSRSTLQEFGAVFPEAHYEVEKLPKKAFLVARNQEETARLFIDPGHKTSPADEWRVVDPSPIRTPLYHRKGPAQLLAGSVQVTNARVDAPVHDTLRQILSRLRTGANQPAPTQAAKERAPVQEVGLIARVHPKTVARAIASACAVLASLAALRVHHEEQCRIAREEARNLILLQGELKDPPVALRCRHLRLKRTRPRVVLRTPCTPRIQSRKKKRILGCGTMRGRSRRRRPQPALHLPSAFLKLNDAEVVHGLTSDSRFLFLRPTFEPVAPVAPNPGDTLGVLVSSPSASMPSNTVLHTVAGTVVRRSVGLDTGLDQLVGAAVGHEHKHWLLRHTQRRLQALRSVRDNLDVLHPILFPSSQ